MYTVGAVARMAGITVRTLHHCDQINLVPANRRTDAGYRTYTAPDLERLQRVLGYRELGFGLAEIAAILDGPNADAAGHLRRQHQLLRRRIDRLERIAAAVDRTLKAHQMGDPTRPARDARGLRPRPHRARR